MLFHRDICDSSVLAVRRYRENNARLFFRRRVFDRRRNWADLFARKHGQFALKEWEGK